MNAVGSSRAEESSEALHCAEVVDAPNVYGIRSTVHFCIALGHPDGDEVRGVVVSLDRWTFPAGLVEVFRRDANAQARVEAEIARGAASQFLLRDRRVAWRTRRLD
jgi:hypothetical protein